MYLMLFFSFNYVVLFAVLFLRFYIFVLLVRMVSLWVGLIFFLVYIGALLVLFFFIFSLSNNEGLVTEGRTSLLRVSLAGGLLILPLADYSITCSGVYSNQNECMVLSGDSLRIGGLILFICLAVWRLRQLNTVKKVPLRPFR